MIKTKKMIDVYQILPNTKKHHIKRLLGRIESIKNEKIKLVHSNGKRVEKLNMYDFAKSKKRRIKGCEMMLEAIGYNDRGTL